ncbi:MAG: ADP-ribosylglycohydrolase family protein [Ignavibacteriota bacterium]
MKILLTTTMCLAASVMYAQTSSVRKISVADLHDKIEGGWAGKMIGVSLGAPTEFRSLGKILEGPLQPWTPDRVSNSLDQDDLYVNMVFAKVLDDKGLKATSQDFGDMFRDSKFSLWHANLTARRNLKRGIPADQAGSPAYNSHANDIDFQIEADFIGLMAPGLPQSDVDLSWRAGRVMNYGDGIYGGMFVSCMYSTAFFEKDPRKIVEGGLACMPAASPYAKTIADVLAWSKENPNDWKKVWQLIEDKWDKRDPCPSGALRPFNIDAKLNGAYLALGLLYGNSDFGKTIDIATRAGQDSDCNPSTAGGILGVAIGYRAIPDEWKSGIDGIAEKKFNFTDFTFHSIVDSTQKRAIALVEQRGGKLQGDTLEVKTEQAKAPKLELWDDYGSPVERVATDDARWTFKGEWTSPQGRGRRPNTSKISGVKDAEASISFNGTGAIVVGSYLLTGGKADVYLDGKLNRTVDVYPDEEHAKGGEAVWHAFGLKPGDHTVRLVVRGETYPGSKGTDIQLEDIVIFR